MHATYLVHEQTQACMDIFLFQNDLHNAISPEFVNSIILTLKTIFFCRYIFTYCFLKYFTCEESSSSRPANLCDQILATKWCVNLPKYHNIPMQCNICWVLCLHLPISLRIKYPISYQKTQGEFDKSNHLNLVWQNLNMLMAHLCSLYHSIQLLSANSE